MGRIIRDLSEKFGQKFSILVGHIQPDEDVWFGFWLAERFGLCKKNFRYEFVSAGTSLSGTEGDPTVLHIDTGGGEFDQHGRSLKRACSAELLLAKLGLLNEPGLQSLLEWVRAVDNVEELPVTHLHFYVGGLHRQRSCFGTDNKVDWLKVRDRVYEVFDNLYDFETRRQSARGQLADNAGWYRLESGLKVCSLIDRPNLREAAFDKGADVVVWTVKNGSGYYVGVQVNRKSSVDLRVVAALLRYVEGRKRGLELSVKDLGFVGQREPMRGWFLHDSLKLILCGSPKSPLAESEYTRLEKEEVVQVVLKALK